MSNQKLHEVLDRYEAVCANAIGPEFAHLHSMIPKMREMLEEGRREKLMRWLGFMQGVLWAAHAFTLEELKEHNRP